jgi:uncharacterized protein with HEPN domain
MLPARDPAYIWDMLDAARSVLEFVGNMTLQDYLADTNA